MSYIITYIYYHVYMYVGYMKYAGMVWCHKTPHCLGVISEAPWGNPHGEWNTTIRSSCH